jgi:trans-aconitate methyltransferase
VGLVDPARIEFLIGIGPMISTLSRMNLAGSFRKLLCVPGVQYVTTRWCGKTLRRWSFDEKFRSGGWDRFSEPPSELVEIVQRHAAGGHILMLGCGHASIAGVLPAESFASILGIDLSTEAISLASRRANHRIRFEVGDMLEFQSEQKFSVILFSESLYYIKASQREALVRRMVRMLTPAGRIVITVAQPDRFAAMLQMLRDNFTVTDDRNLPGSSRHVIVLH